MTTARPWIIFLDVPWDNPDRRNRQHFLVEALARRLGRAGTVLAVERPMTPGKCLRNGMGKSLAAWLGREDAARKVTDNLSVLSVPGLGHELILERFPFLKERNLAMVAGRISRLLPDQGPQPVVMIQHPYQESFLGLFRAAIKVYDRHDDYAAGPQVFPGQRKGIAKREWGILAKADLVTVVTDRMEEEISPRCRRALLLTNALDRELMTRARAEPTPLCCEILGRPRPVAGFIGKMTPRVDYRLLDEAAAMAPEVTFLLVGPLEGTGREERRWLSRLGGRGNVIHAGPKPYAELASYFKSIDVGLIPYRADGFNLASNPLKVYEYLGAGKPVVATGIRPPADLPGVRVCRGAAEVQAGIHSLAGKSIAVEALEGVPRWEDQADELIKVVATLREEGA